MDPDLSDEFQDAYEFQPASCSMDLENSLEEVRKAFYYFLNNKFEEVQKVLDPWVKTSMYHALGNSTFTFLQAMLTNERQYIEAASEALKISNAVYNKYRRNNNISSLRKIMGIVNYDSYTPEEIHAELCYAEGLLLKSMLTLIEDESLASFIKAGIKIRSCYHSFKECSKILHSRHWKKNESHKVDFECGVSLGIGSFNLMISNLPTRVIKLLEFVGFSGSKEIGLQQLQKGCRLNHSLHQVLCVVNLLSYHLIVLSDLSHSDGDLKFCDEILKSQMQLYPQSMLFLFFKGRLEFRNANIDDSIEWYVKSWKSQNSWPHFHNLCFWDLFWANCVKQDWREASTFAHMLLQQSKWSRTVYSYQKAVVLLMLGDTVSPDEKHEIETLMRDAPRWKQRIGGKALPVETFVVKKSQRYFAQKQMLVLPAIELMYLWNLFKVLGKRRELIEGIHNLIEKTRKEMKQKKQVQEFDSDNRALVLLLKAASLRQMKYPLEAQECLNELLILEKHIQDDMYLVPYAKVEQAQILWEQGRFTKSSQLLKEAKKNYTGYSLENRLHFIIHTLEMEMKDVNMCVQPDPMPSTSTSN